MGLFSRKKKQNRESIMPPPPDPSTRVELVPPAPDPATLIAPAEEEVEQEWTGFSSPEEEYIKMSWGGKEKSLVDYEDGFGHLSTKERKDLEVLEPCGFRFKNVIVNTSDPVDLETGEIREGNPFITPDVNNFAKMVNDWKELKRFLDAVGSWVPQYPASRVLFYIDNFKLLPLRKTDLVSNNIFRDHNYTAFISVEPPTKTGKAKKFPIKTFIDISWEEDFEDWYGKKDQPESENITFRAYYLKDGTIGKGEIVYWRNKVSYVLYFALDKDDGYYIKKIETNAGLTFDEWTSGIKKVLYP